MNFTTEYSIWFLPLCIGVAILLSWLLYNPVKFDLSPFWKRTLMGCRTLLFTLLFFFLLGPVVKTVLNRTEKPIVVIAHDNSFSLLQSKDTAAVLTSANQRMVAITQELKDNFEVVNYTFGETAQPASSLSLKEKQTDLSELFNQIGNNYSNRNLSSVILLTDGIYNKGNDPLTDAERIKTAVFTVGLGDTTIRKDVLVYRVNTNQIAYKGNTFPVEVLVRGVKSVGENCTVEISEGGKVLASMPVAFSSPSETRTINFNLTASKPGVVAYQVKISSVKDEIALYNNTFTFYMNVIDAREKILLLAAVPHPDVNALKQSIEENENYECEVFTADKFNGVFTKYNLVILHQIPTLGLDQSQILNGLKNFKGGLWFITGTQTNYNLLNTVSYVSVNASRMQTNEVTPSFDKNFSLFVMSDELLNVSKKFAPLVSPYGNFKFSNPVSVLATQKIGSVETSAALISFSDYNNQKQCVVAGEGLWRWKMGNYLNQNNHNAFNEYVSKTIQYLSLKIDNARFKVRTEKQFNENDEVVLNAELYNESYEPVNDPDVKLSLVNETNKNFSYTFSKNDKAYKLNVGELLPGTYRYTAETSHNGKVFKDNGSFVVKEIQLEKTELTANHQLLRQIAEKTGGKFVKENQLNLLPEILEKLNKQKPVIYSEKRFTDLINWEWLMLVVLLFVGFEWFVRKYFGGY